METWKNIAEVSDRYSISNYGRVKKNREVIFREANGRRQLIKESIIKPIPTSYGYLKVRVRKSQKVVLNLIIHKYVALYFCDGYKEGLQVNHIDGNKINNHYSNLEWVTVGQNVRHAWALGLSTNKHTRKPVKINGIEYNSHVEASKSLGVHRETVRRWLKEGKLIDEYQNI